MAETGILYKLTTTAGTLRFNDLTQDACYLLSAVNDLESPAVRMSQRDKPGRPGVVLGNAFEGAITPSIEGVIVFRTIEERQELQRVLLLHASAMLGEDATLAWRPRLSADERQLTVRLAAQPNIAGGVIKAFQLPMIAASPFIESTTESQQYTTYLDTGTGSGGLSFNLTFPFSFNFSSSPATATVTNAGELDAYPTIQIFGPITSPVIRNLTTGKRLGLTSTIAAGDFVEISMKNETVFLNGSSSSPLLSVLDVSTSDWWSLASGVNNVQLDGTSANNTTTRAFFKWRNTYAS